MTTQHRDWNGRPLVLVACDRPACSAAVIGGGSGDEEQARRSRELAALEGWQLGTAEIQVDLCPAHVVAEVAYTPIPEVGFTRLYDDQGLPLNKLIPVIDGAGNHLRGKR